MGCLTLAMKPVVLSLFENDERVLALVFWCTPFCHPYPAFSAAISAQFSVVRTSGHRPRETHWSATARAQML
jgi:hypothetical protein